MHYLSSPALTIKSVRMRFLPIWWKTVQPGQWNKHFLSSVSILHHLSKPAVDTEPKEEWWLLVGASAEPDKLSLVGVSESRPLTISISPVAVASSDVGLDKLWPTHHLQLSGKDNKKDKERKSVMIYVLRVATPWQWYHKPPLHSAALYPASKSGTQSVSWLCSCNMPYDRCEDSTV